MFEYNKYYPTESDFPTADVVQLLTRHNLTATPELISVVRAGWAECNIHHDVQGDEKVYQVRLERTEIAEVFVSAKSAEEAQQLAKDNTDSEEFEYSGTQIISAEEYNYA
jgi:hypothetical protein